MDEDDTLVRRRSRRSTAGNRMEAALAELSLEDVKDEVDDKDFVIVRDEEDVFESDFESTDEEVEAAQQTFDAGEKLVERREKKTAQSRIERATAAAHARQRVTFNPEIYDDTAEETSSFMAKKRRRVSLGLAIDAETGEVINNAQRQSRRSHTILNTSATAQRMKKDAEDKKSVPKKSKLKARTLTQDELIARALDMEEGNIIEHRNYLSVEEEKRKRAHAVRTAISGPLLRWVSRRETVSVLVETQCPPDGRNSASNSTFGIPDTEPVVSQPADSADASLSKQPSKSYAEDVAMNYVVHETSQDEPPTRPVWKDTMAAMFGDHVRWEDVKAYVSRGRPLSRPVQLCPITGRPARYLDPRTNVPYATPAAYQVLTMILNHDYVWSSALGCYVTLPENPVLSSSGLDETGKANVR
ncbi:YL1 nuclear protein-domain-containing protein [Multifurca ochricompacta]|uniref:YL1 nuclear protein-domain-containing protein n=1 Tax=Multifurca ochricompacta TaxID=376703 RepID=A0AAD4MBL8_9AGAM|nr:YL1 nuclear protein-domain-containing protein [Multifurca ochricompacta]